MQAVSTSVEKQSPSMTVQTKEIEELQNAKQTEKCWFQVLAIFSGMYFFSYGLISQTNNYLC